MSVRRNEPWIVLAAIAAFALLAVASHAETPEPADPTIVALGADLQASNTAHTHMVQSLQALVVAYQGEKAKLAVAQKQVAADEAQKATLIEWLKAAQAEAAVH